MMTLVAGTQENDKEWKEELNVTWLPLKMKVNVLTTRWNIDNIHGRLNKNELITKDFCVTESSCVSASRQRSQAFRYRLTLNDRGKDPKFIHLKIEKVEDGYSRNVRFWLKLCILRSDGITTNHHDMKRMLHGDTNGSIFCWPIDEFISREKLTNEADLLLLPNDTLTILSKCFVAFQSTEVVWHLADQMICPAPHYTRKQISDNQKYMLKEGLFSDFTICVGSRRKFKVHRNILAHHSPVFRTMFEADMAEKQQQSVVIQDTRVEVIEEMLEFVYTGNAPRVNTMAEELLAVADKYDITELKKLCEKELTLAVSVQNAIHFLIFAEHCNLSVLKEVTMYVIVRNANHLLKTKEWRNLWISHLDLMKEIVEQMAQLNAHFSQPPE